MPYEVAPERTSLMNVQSFSHPDDRQMTSVPQKTNGLWSTGEMDVTSTEVVLPQAGT